MPISKVQKGDLVTSSAWNNMVDEINLKTNRTGDTFSGALTITESLNAKNATLSETLTVKTAAISESLKVGSKGKLAFGEEYFPQLVYHGTPAEYSGEKISFFGAAIGVQNKGLYLRSRESFNWYLGGSHSDVLGDPGTGGARLMGLNAQEGLFISGNLTGKKATFSETLTANGGLTGNTASFSGELKANGGLTGNTASFSGNLAANGGLTGNTASFSGELKANGGLTGNTATFSGSATVDTLYVSGYLNRSMNYGWSNGTGNAGRSAGTYPYSILANQRIAASEFNAHSDARIKQKLNISNTAADLATLMQLKVTDYTMIDTVSHGNRQSKKLIAQEVATVYPNAVSYTKGFIPNIYQLAQIENGFVTLPHPDLAIGDKVRLIFEDQQIEVRVTEIDKNGFSVLTDKPEFKLSDGAVFVFGKEVDDFHTVDYDAITMLNTSATQALVKQLHGLESQHADLKAHFEALEKQIQSFKAETIHS